MQRPPARQPVPLPPKLAQQPAASQREVEGVELLWGRERQPSGKPKAPPQLPEGVGANYRFGGLPVLPPARIQAKLMVNEPGDAYEREADEMAERVMEMEEGETHALSAEISPVTETIQRQEESSESEEDDNAETPEGPITAATEEASDQEDALIQRKSDSPTGGFMAPASLTQHLHHSQNSGTTLPTGIRQQMERAYGVDFANVRIHTDEQAVSMNRMIQARAFTYGKRIYFNKGEFVPESKSGQRLIAHELAHTLQQNRDLLMRKTADSPVQKLNQEQAQSDTALDTISTDMAEQLQSGSPAQARLAGAQLNVLDVISRRKVLLLIRKKLPAEHSTKISTLLESSNHPGNTTSPLQSPVEEMEQTARTRAPKSDTNSGPAPAPEVPAPTQQRTSKKAPEDTLKVADERPVEQKPAEKDLSKTVQTETPPSKKASKDATKEQAEKDEKLPALADLLDPVTELPEAPLEENELSSELNNLSDPTLSEAPDFEAVETDALGDVQEELTAQNETDDALAPSPEAEAVPEPQFDPEPFVESLKQAPESAQTSLEEQEKKIKKHIGDTARTSLNTVNTLHEKTVSKIETDIEQRKKNLDKALKDANQYIEDTFTTQFKAASTQGTDGRQMFKDVFSNHRITIENATIDNKSALETLHYDQTLKAQQKTTDKAAEARRKGQTKAASYPASGRGRVQADAAKGVAEKTAQEIEGNEPDVLKAIDEVIEPLPEKFDTLGAEALVGYDRGLPDLLSGVDKEVKSAQEILINQAKEAKTTLAKIGKVLSDKLNAIKTAALAKANAIRPQAEPQILASKQKAFAGISKATKLALKEINGIATEAVGILDATEDPDPENTQVFTQAVLDYIQGVSEETVSAMETAGEGSSDLIQKIPPPARKGYQEIQKETDTQLKDFDTLQNTKLETFKTTLDKNFSDTLTKLDNNFKAAKTEVEKELGKAVKALEEKFKSHYKEAEKKISEKINEGLAKNDEALSKQVGSMNEAASDAAWDYDHPILSAVVDVLSFILGAIVAILAIIAVIVLVIVAIKVLAAGLVIAGLTAATAALVAKIIIVGGLLVYSVYQGYQSYKMRVAAGESSGSAFLGVLGDFTGINAIKDGFTKEGLSPYERGKSITEGTITLITTVLGARGMVKKFVAKAPPRLPNPHKPLAKKPPVSTPKPPVKKAPVAPHEPPASLPKPVEPPSVTTPKQTPTPKTPTPDRIPASTQKSTLAELPAPPKPKLKLVPTETPANTNQKPLPISPGTPKPARTQLKLVSSEANPKLSPPKGKLKAVPAKGNPKTGTGKASVPETLPEAQAKPMAKAVGAECYEPMQIESGVNKPKFQVIEGGMANQPGGQSPLQVMASGAKKGPGGGSLRPAASGGTGRSTPISGGGGGGKPISPGKSAGTGVKSSAGSSTKAPAKPSKATPAKTKAAGTKAAPTKAKPGKATPAKTKAAGTKATPVKAKPSKGTPVKTKSAGTKAAPTKAKPGKATPAKTKAAGTKATPAKAKPSKGTPVKTKAAGTKATPTKAKPGKAKPAKTKAAGAKATPAKAKPSKATPAKSKAAGTKKQAAAPKGGMTINPNWKPTQAQLNLLLKTAKPPKGSPLDKKWRFARYKANGGKKSFKNWLPGSYGGRGGGKGHQQIQQKLTDVKQGAPKGAKKEVTVGNRAADAYWPPEKGKPAVYHQIGGKNPKRMDPIARERSAIDDLRKVLGKQVDIWFWDKRNPAAPPLKNPDLQPNWH